MRNQAHSDTTSGKTLWFGGSLALAPFGAPSAYFHVEDVITFLNSAGSAPLTPILDAAAAAEAALP